MAGEKMKFYIGIDIGLKGGIVVLDSGGKIRYRVAMLKKADDSPDVKKIFAIIAHFKKLGDVHVIIERFAGFFGQSKKSVASLERQGGKIYGMIDLMDIPHTASLPKNWQTFICGDTQQYTKVTHKKTGQFDANGKEIKKKVEKKDTKKIALVTVNRLYPTEEWLKTPRCSTPHDGMVDACLLALYGLRKRL